MTPRLHVVPEVRLAAHGAVTEYGAETVWPVMLRAEPPVLVIAATRVRLGWFCGVIFNVPKFKLAGIILTVPPTSVIVAEFVLVVSVTDVAVTVTAEFVGTAEGAE